MKTERVAQEDRIAITATRPWLSAPASLLLSASGRSFEIAVDSGPLPEGLHFAEILGHDATAPWRGPVFRFPARRPLPHILSYSRNCINLQGINLHLPHFLTLEEVEPVSL